MIRDYKKRFVRITMILVGSVLLASLLVLDVYLAQRTRRDLELTMSQVVDPLNALDGFTPDGHYIDETTAWEEDGEGTADAAGRPPGGKDPGGMTPPEGPGGPGQDPQGGPGRERRSLIDDENRKITVVFVNQETGSYSLLSRESSIEEERISSALPELVTVPEGFGRLGSAHLYYYRDGKGPMIRIALTDSLAVTGEILRNSLILFGIFVLAMGLFLIISIRLSAYAARPMEEAMEREHVFVADISHDLKTPITVIKANNSILRSAPDSTIREQEQWLDGTDRATDDMLSIINEMLTLSQLEGEAPAIRKEHVNLSEEAERALLTLESVAYEKNVALEDEIESGLFTEADPDLVGRVFSGLLENALKYEPAGGRVIYTLKSAKKKAVLTVRNQNSYIPEEDLPHVFDRFYRGDKTREEQKGHGLGLSIVQRSVELSGGTITAASDPENGTVFRVEFVTVS